MWPARGCIIGGAPADATTDARTPTGNVPTTVQADGIWTPDDAVFYLNQRMRGTQWPTLSDPSFSSVKMLMHMNEHGTNGQGNLRMLPVSHYPNDSEAFETTGQTVTALMSQTRKFGIYSFLVHTGSHIVHNTTTVITLGAGDFTLEGWIYATTNLTGGGIWDFRPAAGTLPIILTSNTAPNIGHLTLNQNSIERINDAVALTTSVWHHFAWARDSGNNYLYKDGVQVGATWVDSTNYGSANTIRIGSNFSDSLPWPGYVDEFRCTVGVSRYPGGTTFAVPTDPFPDY